MVVFKSMPAAIHMLNKERGDLYVAILETGNAVVVKVDVALSSGDSALNSFQPGAIGLDDEGRAILIRLYDNSFTDCEQLDCVAKCPFCGYHLMFPDGATFTCMKCGRQN